MKPVLLERFTTVTIFKIFRKSWRTTNCSSKSSLFAKLESPSKGIVSTARSVQEYTSSPIGKPTAQEGLLQCRIVCPPGSPVIDRLGGSIVFARNEGMSISAPLERSERRLPVLLRVKNALIIRAFGLYAFLAIIFVVIVDGSMLMVGFGTAAPGGRGDGRRRRGTAFDLALGG